MVSRLFDRISDPLAWSDPDKSLLAVAIAVGFATWYLLSWLYARRHPEFAPYIDQRVLGILLGFQVTAIAAWIILGATALTLRRRRRRAPWLIGATIALLTYHISYVAYFQGAFTDALPALLLVVGWTGGLILLPREQVRAARWAWWLVLICTTAAAQAGVLPYAPLYREIPLSGGRLDSSWLIVSGAGTLSFILITQVAFYFIIERWRDRERRLAIASRHLAQANEVISRCIASQLAEQIFAGDYAVLERQERRRLTLFFSDIQGFAATADSVEPEDLSLQLNEYLSEMTSIAERYGATIDKFVGDAIMIFFGAPATTDDRDQALRAVRMAIDMQRRLAELRPKWANLGLEHPFHVRIGINTGQASVGGFGSQSRFEYTAIGRQVNLAARLQAECEPDRILVAHSTYTLVRDDIECVPRGEISIKGFRSPVKAYEIDPALAASRG